MPILLLRLPQLRSGGADLQLKGLLVGVGMVPYSVSLLHTEVVRAILLFYLTPIWSALLARLVLGEAITPVRWFSMALGLLGLVVILRSESAWPLPANAGDWLALSAGVLWAVAAVALRRGPTHDALDLTGMNFIWSAIIARPVSLLLAGRGRAGACAGRPFSEHSRGSYPPSSSCC